MILTNAPVNRTRNVIVPFDNYQGCGLYLPFYLYGAESTKIRDKSKYGRHATITGAVPNRVGGAYGWYCDGTNDRFTLSNVFTTNQTGLTILSWVYCHAFDQNVGVIKYNGIYYNRSANEGYYLRVQHTAANLSRWDFAIADGAAVVVLQTATSTDANFNIAYQNKWICVCSSFEASTRMKLWIGGSTAVADKTVGVPAVMDAYTGATDYIGFEALQSDYSNFTFGEIIIFNRAFTDTELRNYYELTRRKYGV